MAKQTKKRDRIMISPPSVTTKLPHSPITPPSQSAASGQDDEYERALAFLRDFHSRRVVTTCAFSSDAFDGLRRWAPLYTIIESDEEGRGSLFEDELSYEFSWALRVVTDDDTRDDAESSRRMRKTARSKCLSDEVYGGSPSTESSSSCSSADDESLLATSHDYDRPSHDYDHYSDLYDDDVRGMRKMTKHSRGCIALGCAS